ncbi:hypothetical protein J437_LFUL016747 [Ladona fulva]|uniref:HTH psq-type domain-containing protein n=1 Tax=Ladona fulva TaxID=123851 RepID=A0A8K0P5A1_LADFU|nr:hypothetical protein J437_LFUL016747 [Ladona fulva]
MDFIKVLKGEAICGHVKIVSRPLASKYDEEFELKTDIEMVFLSTVDFRVKSRLRELWHNLAYVPPFPQAGADLCFNFVSRRVISNRKLKITRKYKRTPGSRKYADFTTSTLEECLNAIRSGEMSQKQAADHYNISRSTIKRRLKNDLPIKPGHPTVFTSDEEMAFASHLEKVCDFGFPVDELVFRYIVKCHLEKQGRFANNVKRARAAIDETVVSQFVDNLIDLTKDFPPDHDLGRSRVIFRGYKYPERVINSTKSTMTIMFCGNTAGSSIPPYIVYKAEQLWTTWAENGPMGDRYNRSKRG